MKLKQRLKRAFCWHKYNNVGVSYFGGIYHCPKCNGVFYEYGSSFKHYMGQYEDFFDENDEPLD